MKRLADWWFAAVPAERLAGFRILLGLFCVSDLATRAARLAADRPAWKFKPVGVTNLIDAPLPPWLVWSLVGLALGLAVLFTIGWRYRVVGPAFAVVLLWVLTYRNSWGMVFHTENLQVLHVAILAFAPAADAWSLDARRRAPAVPDGRYGWALRAAAAVVAIAYLIAGLAKLRLAGFDWLEGEQLRNQIAYDNLRRAVLGARPSVYATPMLEHPEVFAVLAGMTMFVEVGAPLALAHRWLARLWALTAWGFHVGVLFLMHILFPYPMSGVAFAPLFAIERPMGWVGRKVASLVARVRRTPAS